MKLLSKILICFFIIVNSPLWAQNVSLTGTIYDYATYYVSSFDPQTGASDFQLFRYTLSSDSYPVWVKISFRATMVSPALGINTETAILDLYTSPFIVENDISTIISEVSRTSTGKFGEVDDGPSHGFGSLRAYKKVQKKVAERMGWMVVNHLLDLGTGYDVESRDSVPTPEDHVGDTAYQRGPVTSVSFFL